MTTPTTTDAAPARRRAPSAPSDPSAPPRARADRPARPASRPHGQWKVDGTEPLNANEEWKQEDNGLNVRERIEQRLLQGRVRLDRPDRPARPLPLVGPLHAAQARHRRRPDRDRSSRTSSRTSTSCSACASTAAQLTTEQLRVIARHLDRVRPRHRRPHRPAEHPAATGSASRTCPRSGAASRRVGLGTTEACGDVPRVVLGSPGRRHRRRRAHRPHAARSTRSRAASSATRRSRTCPASSRRRSPATPARTSCTRSTTSRFVAVEHPELGVGYDLWVGGGLSTAPRLAERLGVFVAPEQRRRGLARRRPRSSATTATGACATRRG